MIRKLVALILKPFKKRKKKELNYIKDINALSSIGLVIDSVTIENENGSIFYTIKSKQNKTTKKKSSE